MSFQVLMLMMVTNGWRMRLERPFWESEADKWREEEHECLATLFKRSEDLATLFKRSVDLATLSRRCVACDTTVLGQMWFMFIVPENDRLCSNTPFEVWGPDNIVLVVEGFGNTVLIVHTSGITVLKACKSVTSGITVTEMWVEDGTILHV